MSSGPPTVIIAVVIICVVMALGIRCVEKCIRQRPAREIELARISQTDCCALGIRDGDTSANVSNGGRLLERRESGSMALDVEDPNTQPYGVAATGGRALAGRTTGLVESTQESQHHNINDVLSSSLQGPLPEMTRMTPLVPNRPAAVLQMPIPTAHSMSSDDNRASARSSLVVSESAVAMGHRDANRNVVEAQSAVLAPVHPSSPEPVQITSIMEQMDDMWAAIARLRQAHLECTPVHMVSDETSDVGSSPLPDYVSIETRPEYTRSTLRQ